jgi:branched-chain amino acid transport system substrate-binding protein
VRAYQKEYGVLPSYYACATYTSAQWLTEALERLGSDIRDTDRVLATLRSVRLPESCFGPMKLDRWGGTVGNIYLRKVVRNDEGKLVNQVVETEQDVSQFWRYKPEAFLQQPVYSRAAQGQAWPAGCDAYAEECPLP